MSQTQPHEDQKPKIDWVKSPSGVFEMYANLAHITWSLDDVRIRLAQLVDNPKTPNPGPGFQAVAQERAAVTLSWRNAKIMRNNLTKIIDAYEKTNGEITTESKLVESMP